MYFHQFINYWGLWGGSTLADYLRYKYQVKEGIIEENVSKRNKFKNKDKISFIDALACEYNLTKANFQLRSKSYDKSLQFIEKAENYAPNSYIVKDARLQLALKKEEPIEKIMDLLIDNINHHSKNKGWLKSSITTGFNEFKYNKMISNIKKDQNNPLIHLLFLEKQLVWEQYESATSTANNLTEIIEDDITWNTATAIYI